MRKFVFLPHLLFICLFFSSFNISYSQDINKEAILLRTALEKNHFSPRSLDDQFSKDAFSSFIDALDPDHIYFTDAELKKVSAYELKIDDELKGSSWKFLPNITALFKERLLVAEKTFTNILQKPFNFSTNETVDFEDDDSLDFASDEKAYLQRWNKWLKYQTLWQLINIYDEKNPADDKTILSKDPEMRQKVLMIEKRNIKRILEHPQGYENYVASLFFNTITSCYDPHSAYFSKSDWENFESKLSKDAFSFGIDLEENERGNITIARLVPGGPAWKSNELHKGDVLVELKWSGKNSVDLTAADLSEVENLLGSSNSERLEITVKKTSGLIKTISLLKEKIREDENVVKSFILKGGDKKIGYIALPGFYTEWENMSGLGCANDVAKEIIKLKEENIDGLILDIRYNGGGSLMEGMNLTGIFINEGPLMMLKGKDGKPYVMKDMNRGTVYDGPLVVMVNGQSASASEVLASTLQDYNRAVIVGSTTFGKATGQSMTPLDTTVKLSDSKLKSPWGILTITVEKLYRVTGKSAQIKGVQPDIIFPDIYEELDYKENSYPFVLPSDSVIKKVFYSPLAPLPIKALAKQSATRLSANEDFQRIKKMAVSFSDMQEDIQNISLNFIVFKNKIQDRYKLWNSMEASEEKLTDVFTVENTHYENELMKLDSYSTEINSLLIKKIKSSIYIEETFKITADLINLTKN